MLKTTGATSTTEAVKTALDTLMTAEAAAEFSWSGIKTTKPGFRKLQTSMIIIRMYNVLYRSKQSYSPLKASLPSRDEQ